MKCIFYIAKKYSLPIIKPLAAFAEKNNNWEYRFYVSDEVKKHFPGEWPEEKVLTSLKQAKTFNPDAVLCPGNFVDFRIPGVKVQIFHGLGVEKDSHFKIRHFFDVYLTSGPYVTKRFREAQKKSNYFLIRETGWPKIDHILGYRDSGFLERINIPKNMKVILYAPTFSKKMESTSELLDYLLDNLKDNEYLLVKFHELMDKNIVKKVNERKNVYLIQDYDITPYLHAADVMVSDTSSVIYEFIALKKPVITYKTKGFPEKGIDISSKHDLRKSLDMCYQSPGSIIERGQCVLKKTNPYLDGEICRRIFSELKMIKDENLLANRKKPLNLFRKFQVLFHSVFRKGYLR